MSMFDFFFPEQAEAMHLRQISDELRQKNFHDRLVRKKTRKQEQSADRRLDSLEERVRELEDENAMLGLLTMSLIKVLAEKNAVTMKDVFDQLKAADALDGKVDGKVNLGALRLMFGLETASAAPEETPDPGPDEEWECPTCRHLNASARQRCLYCDGRKPS